MKCVTVKPIKNYEFDQTYYLFISKNIYGEKVSKYNLEGYRMMFTTRAGVTVE
jgi:hypothetical protein